MMLKQRLRLQKTLTNSETKEVIDLPTTSNKATEPLSSTDSKKINPSDNPQTSESTTEKSKIAASLSNQEKPSPTDKAESDIDSSDYSENLSNNPKKDPKTKNQRSVNRTASPTESSDNVNWAQMGKQFSKQQDSKSSVVFITVLAVITVSLLLFGFIQK